MESLTFDMDESPVCFVQGGFRRVVAITEDQLISSTLYSAGLSVKRIVFGIEDNDCFYIVYSFMPHSLSGR